MAFTWKKLGTVLAGALVVTLAVASPAEAKSKPPRKQGQGGTGGAPAGGVWPTTPSPNLQVVGSGELRYRYVRAGVTIELRDRRGRWTDAEARLTALCFDKLPEGYLRKARSGGCEKIYRDGRMPYAPFSFTVADIEGVAGFAVPAWPYRYVSLGDLTFGGGDPAGTYFVLTHELGHCVQNDGDAGWREISWTWGLKGLKSWNGFVSDYARTNHLEDFADTAAFYWIAPTELQRVSPAKLAYMRDRVFGGATSPAGSREPYAAIDPVKPAITALGDSSDDRGSLVQIHGQFFMGPFDGGYSYAKYRGADARELAVSRQRIYSWVPDIAPGSAPITLQTQDGTSNAAAFNVEKDWWKFW